MAAVSPRDSEKSISRKMVSVPLESVTDFPSPSTLTTAGDVLATDAATPAPENDFEMSDMRKPNSMNVTKRHFLSHCSLLGMGILAGGAMTTLPAQAQTGDKPPKHTVLVVGDSLSAEYGLARGTGWVALLQARLAEEKKSAQVINASISGDTTSGGRSRLPALLARHRPSHVIVELGGNDALRGLDLRMTDANLSAMVQAAMQAGARVTVLGMQLPPNYGTAYAREFSQLFARVAQQHRAALVPFFLKGVADGPDAVRLFQADRIHPNEQAQPLMLNNVWPVLKPQLN